MTACAAVMLDDGAVLVATDAATTYADGFRRLQPHGKWWKWPNCVVAYSGSGLYTSRFKWKLDELWRSWKGQGLVEPLHLQDCIFQIQEELKTSEEGVSSLSLEVLYKGAPDGIYIISGDGDVMGPHVDFACVGSGAEIAEGVLTYALKPRRCRKRTKSAVTQIVLEALRITADRRDGVSRPLYYESFLF